jgi:hypothetical protein
VSAKAKSVALVPSRSVSRKKPQRRQQKLQRHLRTKKPKMRQQQKRPKPLLRQSTLQLKRLQRPSKRIA